MIQSGKEQEAASSESSIRLSVIADDFGMHEAINEAIAETFRDGLLTDANVMAPCPAFEEAVRLAKETGLPVGMHTTFTCEFDLYRWGPLLSAKTLVVEDGNFPQAHAWGSVDLAEARREMFAQHDRLRDAGLVLTHLSEHMGLGEPGDALAALQAELGRERNLPHRTHGKRPGAPPFRYAVDGLVHVSAVAGLETRKNRLRERLQAMRPGGRYIWVVHPGADHASLDRLATPGSPVFDWGRPFRALDRALLLDPDVRQWMADLNIVPTPIAEFPITGSPAAR